MRIEDSIRVLFMTPNASVEQKNPVHTDKHIKKRLTNFEICENMSNKLQIYLFSYNFN